MGIGDSLNFGVENAIQSIKNSAGIVTAAQNSKGPDLILPWINSNINSRFFQSIPIDSNRWDQLFPYRLLVIDSTKNQVVYNPTNTFANPQITVTKGTGSAIIAFEQTAGWVFTLPITPQQLTIQDNYAIQTVATLRGILEEHSGVRFKMINAQGSMGVWAQRTSVTAIPGTPGVLQSVFGGTIQAIGDVTSQISRTINTATSDHPANKPVSLRPETSLFGSTSTGYYQALKLQQFLEQYAEAKKDPANASWRLVFDIPKQKQSFVVTPVAYSWLQNANKPMEIMYNFQLKAWRRINLDQPVQEADAENQPLSPGILQRVLNTINQSQRVLSASVNLIGAVRSDVETPLNVLRQTVLFVKGLAGVANTAADLPFQLQSDYRSSIGTSMNILSSTVSTNVSDPTVRRNLNMVVAEQNQNEGLSMAAVANGQLGNNAAIYQSLNPSNNIFSQPESNFALMDEVPLNSLSLTNAQQLAVQQILLDASETTVEQLKQYRATILQLSLQLSNSFGTGSAYYNDIYGLPPPTVRLQPITLDEYEVLASLYETLSCYDILTATNDINDEAIENTMQYVAGLADGAGIQFQIPNSKILAPVPFGLTIEAIAARYLGDAQRWLEIVTLNNLREPYIDEDGFQLPLLSDAIGRQVIVGDATDLYIGQKVIVSSSTQIPSPRTILSIEKLTDVSFLLTMDGLPNLDNFGITDGAYIQAYLPGTVNSQQKIFIPSDLPVPIQSSITPPAGTSSDPLTGLSKVDWLLTDAGDIAVNNFGDFRYASGITNLIQALRIKFGTRAGTILTHPNFGLNIKVGAISTDLQIQDLYNSINSMVRQDPRFQMVSRLQITLDGPVLGISLAIQLPNQTGVFPVSFALTNTVSGNSSFTI